MRRSFSVITIAVIRIGLSPLIAEPAEMISGGTITVNTLAAGVGEAIVMKSRKNDSLAIKISSAKKKTLSIQFKLPSLPMPRLQFHHPRCKITAHRAVRARIPE